MLSIKLLVVLKLYRKSAMLIIKLKVYTVSHFSYAPFFQGPHFWTKMLELNILYDNLLIDILSV